MRTALNPARESLRPPPNLKVSEWATAYRRLSRKDSAKPGRWKSEPHQDAIMDAFVDNSVRRVVVEAASQVVGKSQMMNNVIGRFIHVDPSNMMIVHPSDKAGEKWAVGRLDPLIDETPVLKERVSPRKSRDSDSTKMHRQFRGGQMFVVGVNAPADLASQSVRIVLADEVDRYGATSGSGDRDEGDPLELAEQRTETYGDFAKIGYFSTPVLEGTSRIHAAFLESDQQEWEIRCPHCGEFFAPLWEHVRWDKRANGKPDIETVAMWCGVCGVKWTEGDRLTAIEAGRWDAKGEFEGTRGFHINALGCRRTNLQKLLLQWTKAQGAPTRLKAFLNLKLALCWKEAGEAPDWQRLYDRREEWPEDRLPRGVLMLTGYCDVQKDRLEARIWGWGRDRQSWLIETVIIDRAPVNPEAWVELDRLRDRAWEHESGAEIRLAGFGIDSGYEARIVEDWCRRQGSRVMFCKGDNKGSSVLRAPSVDTTSGGKRRKGGLRPWMIPVDALKEETYRLLRLDKPLDGDAYPPGYIHLSARTTKAEIEQLTAEQRILQKTRNGFARLVWDLPSGRRNEALDCRVGAQAVAEVHGLKRFTTRDWNRLERTVGVLPDRDEGDAPSSAPTPATPPPRQPPRYERHRGRKIYRQTF